MRTTANLIKQVVRSIAVAGLSFLPFAAYAQKPVLTITTIVYVEQKTASYYGGVNAFRDSVALQLQHVNAAFNADPRFNHTYNFSVSAIKTYDNTNQFMFNGELIDSSYYYQRVKEPVTNYAHSLVYDAFPRFSAVAVNWNHSVNVFYRQNTEKMGSIFSKNMDKALTHEFGHTRGQLDLYNGKVPFGTNLAAPATSFETRYSSIMNNCYNESVWDNISVAIFNRTGQLYGARALETPEHIATERAMFPQTINIRVKNALGNVVPNAQVNLYGATAYMTNNGLNILAAPTYSPITNSSGLVSYVGALQNPFDLNTDEPYKYSTFYVTATFNGETRAGWISHVDVMDTKARGIDTYTYDIVLPAGAVPPANVAPFHAFGIAGGGQVIRTTGINTVGISITDIDGDASKAAVKVYRDGAFYKDAGYDNGSFWCDIDDNNTSGEHTVSVQVTDEKGAASPAYDVTKYRVFGNEALKVKYTSPANNASYAAGSAIPLKTLFSDMAGTIYKMDYYDGAAKIISSTTIPFNTTWSTSTQGNHTLTAVATDSLGLSATSAPIVITITAPVGCPDPQYIAGTTYATGTKVKNNGREYQCTVGGWCSSASAWAYEPGVGSAWTSAWTDLGICAGSNTAPAISLTSPSNNTSFPQIATISIAASATDADGTIAKVEFYKGTTLLISDATAPYAYTWTGVSAGTYAIKAVAYDNLGLTSTSAIANITVTNKVPTVTLTAPANNQTFATVPATVSITANAADTDGTIAKVEFYNGATLLNSDVTAPYAYTWTGVAAGTYSITAKVFDNQSSTAVSTPSTIKVGNQAPTVSLTSPVNGATVNQPATISIAATATDADGTVSKVEFYNGTTLLNSDATAPYTYSWTGVAAGNYAIKAIAYDNLGLTTTSSIVNITINNQAPTVTLNTPANNQAYTPAPVTVSITATAADADGTITKVEFYNGTALLNSDITSPYAFSWTGVAGGTYTIKAIAYDNQGKTSSNATAAITVTNAGGNCTAPLWASATVYSTSGLYVQYNNIKYVSNFWTQGSQPDLNNGGAGSGKPWTSLGTCTSRTGYNAEAIAPVIYPNPSKGTFTIDADENTLALVVNTYGTEVTRLALVKGQNEVSLPVAPGVYFIKINATVTKLIIE